MKVISQEIIDELYRLAQVSVADRNLASAAVLLDAEDKPICYSSSKVASEKNALAHADLLVINEGCRIKQSVSLSGCTLISVFEPSLMTLCACYWANIRDVVFIVSAEKYIPQIGWASEDKRVDKQKVIATFDQPVVLQQINDPDHKFETLCDQYIRNVIRKD